MKSIKNFLAAAAIGGLMIAQPLSAATRSASSLPEVGAKVERLGSVSKKSERAVGGGFIIPGIAIAAVLIGLIVIVSDDDDNDSPG